MKKNLVILFFPMIAAVGIIFLRLEAQPQALPQVLRATDIITLEKGRSIVIRLSDQETEFEVIAAHFYEGRLDLQIIENQKLSTHVVMNKSSRKSITHPYTLQDGRSGALLDPNGDGFPNQWVFLPQDRHSERPEPLWIRHEIGVSRDQATVAEPGARVNE